MAGLFFHTRLWYTGQQLGPGNGSVKAGLFYFGGAI